MNYWKTATLGDLVEPADTWNPAKAASDEVFDYIDLSAVDQETKLIRGVQKLVGAEAPSRARQLVANGDVLVSTVRPNLNGVAKVPEELDGATASTGFCILRARPTVLDRSYLFHWVKSPVFVGDMVRKATGASYPAVSDRIIFESRLPIPPVSEQRRIAEVLDRAEALRAKRRAALSQLDTLTQSIFLDLFGDPATNPRGWGCRTLEDITEKITDGEHLNPEFSEAGMPIVMAGNVLDDRVDLENCRMVESAIGERFRRKCDPVRGDLLVVSRGATIGRLCVVDGGGPFCLMGSVILIKPDKDVIESRFLANFLKHPVMKSALYKTSGSSAQQAVYIKDLKRLLCIVPPNALQREFVRRVTAVDKPRAAHRASLAEMDELFTVLQHRAFRGEL